MASKLHSPSYWSGAGIAMLTVGAIIWLAGDFHSTSALVLGVMFLGYGHYTMGDNDGE